MLMVAYLPTYLEVFPSRTQQQVYLQSLRTYDVDGDLHQRTPPAGNTFQWVLNCDEFVSWSTTSGSPILLITGKPGCGKSVLLAFLRRRNAKGTVAFFACKQSDSLRNSPKAILSSLLRQILLDQPNLFRHVIPRSPSSDGWTYHQLLESFQGVLTSADNTGITCMIDALDECPEVTRRKFVKDLTQLSDLIGRKDSTGYSRIVISARNYADIHFPSAVQLDLDFAPRMREDLASFIDLKVGELIAARPHYRPDAHEICESLMRRANGMYRLVELVVLDLEYMTDSSPMSVRQTLHSVPRDIGELYDKIWSRIPARDLERAKTIFQWILCSLSPLSLDAIQIAIAVSSTTGAFKHADIKRKIPHDVSGDLLGLFGPLVKIDSFVDVSHPSVRDHFLTQNAPFHQQLFGVRYLSQRNEANANIAITCLRYLNSIAVDTPQNFTASDFLSYSLKHFAKHVSEASAQSDELDAEVVAFFENGYFTNEWEQSIPHELILAPGNYTPRIRDPLSFACYYGRTGLVRTYLSTGNFPGSFSCQKGPLRLHGSTRCLSVHRWAPTSRPSGGYPHPGQDNTSGGEAIGVHVRHLWSEAFDAGPATLGRPVAGVAEVANRRLIR